MKKFILKWGRGSVCEIRIIYKTLTTEAENIDDINPLEILPEYIKRKVLYVRKSILLKQKEITTMAVGWILSKQKKSIINKKRLTH